MTREQIPSMSVLPLPFAIKGETVVPISELDPFSDSGNEGALGFDSKYQWNVSVPPSRFITRQLMNRLLGQISGRQFLKQCGALDTFDQNVCDAIGGYPQGAVLQYLDGNVLYDVVSMRDNNDTDYTKVGVDGTNWRIYGSSVFMYVYPDYGSIGQYNILKMWDLSGLGWSFVFQGGPPGFTDNLYVSNISYDSINSKWVAEVKYKTTDEVWNTYYSSDSQSATTITFSNQGAISITATRNSEISNDPLTISSPCWIQAFITNPIVSAQLSNYSCGIILYGEDTQDPSEQPLFNNAIYTVYELTELGTVATPILPVLPGDKICVFSTEASTDCSIVIRKLTPVRTR